MVIFKRCLYDNVINKRIYLKLVSSKSYCTQNCAPSLKVQDQERHEFSGSQTRIPELSQEITESPQPHTPVLSQEVLTALNLKPGGRYLDMTFGAGGHSRMILESVSDSTLIGLDRDRSVRKFGDQLQEDFPERFNLIHGKFSELPSLLREENVPANHFDGILMDLGVSSMQFDDPFRGFMLSQDGPLDMRMDPQPSGSDSSPSAADILKHIDEDSLYRVLKYYGQEKKARVIARAVVESRILFKSLRTTKELAELVVSVTGIERNLDKLQRFSHPATKTFQALRILVNDELNELDFGIRAAHKYLDQNGVLVVLSFHSLEDAIVKRHFTGCDLDITPDSIGGSLRKNRRSHLITYSQNELLNEICKPWTPLSKRVITATEEEVETNPRSRSAKLRFASKGSKYKGYE